MKKYDALTIAEQIALEILGEEYSAEEEKEKQDQLSKMISAKKLRSKSNEKESGKVQLTDEADEENEEKSAKKDQETKIEPKPKPEEKPEEKNIDFKVSAPEKIPAKVNFQQIVKQINNLRAGKSLNDKNISKQLEDYYEKLGQAEERSLYVFLSSLASILTGGTEGSEAPRPETAKVDVKLKKKPITPEISSQEDREAPIIVGEVANNLSQKLALLESMSSSDLHKCLNGKMVNFGSDECISDINGRINDLVQMRDSCGTGSADRASMNGTLKYLRQKLRAAQRVSILEN